MKTRKMYENGEDLSWEVIVKLYDHTMLDKFKTNKLTKAHFKLTAFSCMKVLPASQTMSRSVSTEISDLVEKNSVRQGHDTLELCQFITHVNGAFDCFNSSGDAQGKRNKLNSLLASYRSVDDPRFNYLLKDMLGLFRDWEADVKKEKKRKLYKGCQRENVYQQTVL
ncbi:putative 54.7 kDa protein in IAP1-SOD intergenic region [Frankliniella fusca]|uniref:54.7 kDa protein in IAP1-SOD intergenic region n=1 Tax=Frankliniella fusca TaxID=407009 RepID=A0AAE1HAZ5_9NEOP|nr:putative 54.7 kDa protein in IAP1-SOD intergenic region [Frankliniella fusca]